jgi:hypothetical protein
MTYQVFLSTAVVAIILAGAAMLAVLLTLVMGALGRPERTYTVTLFSGLGIIWAGVILVIVLLKHQI